MLLSEDFNQYINKKTIPERIISLCPSITETLCDLGLTKNLAGITDYCVHPGSLKKSIPTIGGPKDVSLEKIKKINPDIIIASKEENKKSTIEQLALHYPYVIFDVQNFDEALKMILRLGEIFEKNEAALKIVAKIREEFNKLAINKKLLSYLYLIWKNPYMAAGSNTFINDMLSKLQLNNSIHHFEKRYPNIEKHFQDIEFDIIFLPSEPYKFSMKDQQELQEKYPHKKVLLIDGEMFSWYGSHMIKAAGYFKDLLPKIEKSL